MCQSDATVTPSEVRRQLQRMLLSRVFAARPRSGSMLRYVVEESLRNGFATLDQRLIATHALGFDADFSPSRSAEVRVKVARLRKAIERYYAGPGRADPVMLVISPGPYRLMVSRNGIVSHDLETIAAREARRTRPLLLFTEPHVSGAPGNHNGLAADVSLRLGSLLAESTLVTVSGPLLRDRITAVEPATVLAASLGYDYMARPAIRIAHPRWEADITVVDTKLGDVTGEFTTSLDSRNGTAPVEAIATWMYHRIGDSLAVRD